ncbi:hypothetical protein XELAEV_18004045mg [Xenopus laevis]|uniref:IF rod domain-containing protein n=2 Tax=Xenopus laevis TaxID=8355 RepID=A0A974BRV9_XENLA|nr:hypothetical protein XELAEV_18004045mg [Xenopus laevis]
MIYLSFWKKGGEQAERIRPVPEPPLPNPDDVPDDPGPMSLEGVGVRFQFCIAAVGQLEWERDELIRELTLLREPSFEAVRRAHEEVLQAFGQKARAELERDALREEVRTVRCKLFSVTREYVACQFQLEKQQEELKEKDVQRGDLETVASRLAEELTQLRTAFMEQREEAQQQLRSLSTRHTSDALQDRRRLSAELQSLTEEQHSSLEEQYEPRFLRLLEHSERGAAALKAAQEELQKLRDELRPLQGEECKMRVQRNSLQEQIVLLKRKREEEVHLYREQIQELEDSMREMKITVQLQQQQNKELEDLKRSLAHELAIYKGCLEIYGQLFKSVTKKE